MWILGHDGKRHDLFDEDETSFIETKSDSESLAASHDQTMVEGQLSNDHVNRGNDKLRAYATLESEVLYESKMDIFTELNILREDLKTSIEGVHSRINSFDGKINHVLELLQTINSTKKEKVEPVLNSDSTSTDANENVILEGNDDGPANRKISKGSQNGGNLKKTVKATMEKANVIDQMAKAVDEETAKGNKNKKKSDASSKKSIEDDLTLDDDDPKEAKSWKRDNDKPSKKDTEKENWSSSKKESWSSKEKQSSNKVSPVNDADSKSSNSKQSKQAAKQAKKRPIIDDLDEIERELEEIGIPNDEFKPKLHSTIRKASNIKKMTKKV